VSKTDKLLLLILPLSDGQYQCGVTDKLLLLILPLSDGQYQCGVTPIATFIVDLLSAMMSMNGELSIVEDHFTIGEDSPHFYSTTNAFVQIQSHQKTHLTISLGPPSQLLCP
jgi:hypothetical protein